MYIRQPWLQVTENLLTYNCKEIVLAQSNWKGPGQAPKSGTICQGSGYGQKYRTVAVLDLMTTQISVQRERETPLLLVVLRMRKYVALKT